MPVDIYDKIMMLAKRRGILFPSFEIYGGCAGFFDYGPLGSRLKQNIENLWRWFFLLNDNCVEISTPTITLHEVLKASGHVDEFTDLTVDCPQCHQSFKLEGLLDDTTDVEQAVKDDKVTCPLCGTILKDPHPVNLMFSTTIGIGNTREAFLRPETAQGIFTDFHLLYRYAREKLPFGVIQVGKGYRNEISPRQGPIRMREFSMAEAEVFFDPEDKNHPRFHEVKDKKVFLFDNVKEQRLSLEDAVNAKTIANQALAYYLYLTQEFLMTAGVDPAKFRFRKHGPDELAHYAQECWDAELFSERFGWVECVGIADRSAYDLRAHIDSSGTDMYALRKFEEPQSVKVKKITPKMDVLGPRFKGKAGKIKAYLEHMEVDKENIGSLSITLDDKTIDIPPDCFDIVDLEEKRIGEKYVPHVIEPSFGIDRILYLLLEHSYQELKKNEEDYHMLRFRAAVAPIKVGVLPLISDERLEDLARSINRSLRNSGIETYYDSGGTIGRRYARMDEVGTPYCVTIDHQSLDDNTVTVRDRDTTDQERKNIDELIAYFQQVLTINL
jgi:glycyl-tRNA synthetase